MTYRLLFLTIFLLLVAPLCLGQSEPIFKQPTGESLSTQSITYGIAQDSIGQIWIASEEGVLRHNGASYKSYTTYKGLPSSFNNRISVIHINKHGKIIVGLEKGVGVYNPDLDIFEALISKEEVTATGVYSIAEDNKGDLWIGASNGLWKYEPRSNSQEIKRKLTDVAVETLVYRSGYIYFGNRSGLFSYTVISGASNKIDIPLNNSSISTIRKISNLVLVGTKTGILYSLDTQNKINVFFQSSTINVPIKDIIQNENGEYFVGTDGQGVLHLSEDRNVLDWYREDVDVPFSLNSNGVYDLLLGKEDILWVATYGGGVNFLDRSLLPFQRIKHELNSTNSLNSNFTRAISKDNQGNIWFGTKKGISIWNQEINSWNHIPSLVSKGDNADIVLALEPDDDMMWVGTYNAGLFKVNIRNYIITKYSSEKYEPLVDRIYALKKDKLGNLWVGGIQGATGKINQAGDLTTYDVGQVKSFLLSSDNEILAVGRRGATFINIQSDVMSSIEAISSSKSDIAFTNLNAIERLDATTLLFATNGAGLIFYNEINKEIVKTLNGTNGMPSDIVQGIIVQDENTIWASTTRGLVQITLDRVKETLSIYDTEDGLASTEFNYGSFEKLSDSLFAFGGVDGVTLLNPNNIVRDDYRPSLIFDRLKLFNREIAPNEKPLTKHINESKLITLNHDQNSIELDFSGVLYSAPAKVKYSWILEGLQDNWSPPSSISSATYTSLPPGDYKFKVKASNKYGQYGDERSLKLVVKSPWWATGKAYIVYALAALLLIYTIIHFTSIIVKKRNADEQIDFYNNITHELKTPLSILLSSLDSATDGVDGKDSKKQIKSTVSRINSLFEQMLNFHKVTAQSKIEQDIKKINLDNYFTSIIKDFSPLAENKSIKVQFKNEWNDVDFYHDKEVLDKVSFNLISNAIKYSNEKGIIKVKLSKTKLGQLKMDIIDEGMGIPEDQQKFILKRFYRARNVINSQSSGTGLGLMMVYRLLEKTGGSISFKSKENVGSTFTVLLKNYKIVFDKINNIKTVEEDQPLIKESPVALTTQSLEAFSDSKILIVEDNDELRTLMVKRLGLHFQIAEASNGQEGLETASSFYPDIILTDLIMPVMDGLEMAKNIKDDINLNHIPVFMLTVLQNSNQKQESIESGISEYIQKPVDMKFLLAKIVNTLKFQKRLQKRFIKEGDSDTAALFKNKNDRKFLKKLQKDVIENLSNEDFSVHDLSHNFGMSRTSLYMKLKNLVDLSPQDFIIHTKLKYAKKLLIKGDRSIKEVAYTAGFSNPKYFSTSFKKFYGVSPSGFLASLRKEN